MYNTFCDFYFKESDRVHIIWWSFLALSIIGIFIFLKAPILDLSYLDNPKIIKLEYASFEKDNNYEYSVKHKLIGSPDNGEIKIFDINDETYDREKEKWEPNVNVIANVKYLPIQEF